MNDFEYSAVATVEEAVRLLAARGDRARVLTGGTDLIVQLREGQRDADLIVDVKKIPQLMSMEVSSTHGLQLGAAVACHKIYECPEVAELYPGLADAAKIIGGWQVQSRASIGGNLCNASPAADSIPMLIAYDVRCRIAGPGGERTVPVAEFCVAPGKNCLAQGELLVSLDFPMPAPHSSGAYLRFIPRNEMDIAVVGVGAWVKLSAAGDTIEDARLGVGAVAPTPLFAAEASQWLKGKPASDDTFAQAADLAKKVSRPITDKRGPAEYRTHLVGVLTRRALSIASARASRNNQ